MKYVKMLGLVAMVAAALMAFAGAGTASATTLTDGSGNHPPSLAATSSHLLISNGVITVTCTHSALNGTITQTGGTNETVKGTITSLDFTNCANQWHYSVVGGKFGTLEFHTDPEGGLANGNGILTSSGIEITAEQTSSGLHCVMTTSNTEIGTITGSKNTKGTAVLDIDADVPRTGGRSGIFCGGTTHWTGTYVFTSPDYLDID